ncbi:winged helix-turn-helix transcriptional regulator [Candidatus Woesebacteria bacterium]|nr:winged helix-turn-helix transcriptional regulator [Candidatus Woesebacteria bacterium]
MISKVRVKMMLLFFNNADELYYVREITREINEEINAVRRELEKMVGYGLLKSEQRGNRMYYFLNKRYQFFQELQQMVVKSSGLGKKMVKLRRKLGDVSFIMFAGHFVRGQPPRNSAVDLLVVGDIVIAELQALIKEQEEVVQREINYAVFSDEEFEFRKTRRDPFVMDILYSTKVMVIGNEDDFSERSVPGI